MKLASRLLAVGLGVATMVVPDTTVGGEADSESTQVDAIPAGLILTNSCDDVTNLRLARENSALLVDHQLLVSCWNARHNLVKVCPWMFPDTSALLASGPDRWFSRVYESLWIEQSTPEAVIDENRRVVQEIERRVHAALVVCMEAGETERALTRCQRSHVKASIK